MSTLSTIPVWFFVAFAIVVGVILWRIGKAAFEGLRNNAAPQEYHAAQLVSKRMHVSGSDHSYTYY